MKSLLLVVEQVKSVCFYAQVQQATILKVHAIKVVTLLHWLPTKPTVAVFEP